MMRLRLFGSLLGVLVAPLLLDGCGGDSDKTTDPLPPTGGDVSVPLHDGDHWTYRVTELEPGARPAPGAATTPLLHELQAFSFLAIDRVDHDSIESLGGNQADASETIRNASGPSRSAGGTVEVFRTIGETLVIDGLSYTAVLDSADGETSGQYYRQAGKDLWTQVFFAENDDPIVTMIYDALTQTLPWKVASFGVASGTAWTVADLDTLVLVEGLPVDVDISITGENLGVSAVTLPAGQWPEAQRIRTTQTVAVSVEGFFRVTQTFRQDDWWVDNVGLVREDVEGTFTNNNQSGSFKTTMEVMEFEVR